MGFEDISQRKNSSHGPEAGPVGIEGERKRMIKEEGGRLTGVLTLMRNVPPAVRSAVYAALFSGSFALHGNLAHAAAGEDRGTPAYEEVMHEDEYLASERRERMSEERIKENIDDVKTRIEAFHQNLENAGGSVDDIIKEGGGAKAEERIRDFFKQLMEESNDLYLQVYPISPLSNEVMRAHTMIEAEMEMYKDEIARDERLTSAYKATLERWDEVIGRLDEMRTAMRGVPVKIYDMQKEALLKLRVSELFFLNSKGAVGTPRTPEEALGKPASEAAENIDIGYLERFQREADTITQAFRVKMEKMDIMFREALDSYHGTDAMEISKGKQEELKRALAELEEARDRVENEINASIGAKEESQRLAYDMGDNDFSKTLYEEILALVDKKWDISSSYVKARVALEGMAKGAYK